MQDLGLFGELSGPVVGRIVDAAVHKRYPSNNYLFHAGDAPDAVYIVETGLLRVDRSTPSGRQVLLTLAQRGGIVGELSVIDRSPRSASCSVISTADVLVLSESSWNDLLRSDPEVAAWVSQRVVRRLRALTDQLVAASALDARGRIAARLCDLIDMGYATGNDSLDLRLPISQEELAHWAGLSREGAVKGIRELRDSGVITTGRMRVTVAEPETLSELARAARL